MTLDPKIHRLTQKLNEEVLELFSMHVAFSGRGAAGATVDVGDTQLVNLRRILDDEPGVDYRVDEAVTKRYFRELAKKYHPDNAETGDATKFSLAREAFKAKDIKTLFLMLNASFHVLSAEEEEELISGMVAHMSGVVEKFRGSTSFSIASCYVAGGKPAAMDTLTEALQRKIRACFLARTHNPNKES